MILQALALTLRLAVLVSVLLMAIGLPLGYWLAFSRWRWKFVVEAVVSLPIVLPPTVLGFYVLVAIGPLSPVGTLVSRDHRRQSGLHLSRIGDWLGALQLALRGAAHSRRVLVG